MAGYTRRMTLIAATALPLMGCATGAVDKDFAFDAASNKAVVVFGWEGLDHWRNRSIYLYFNGVDAGGMLDKRRFSASNGNGWNKMESTEYFVMEVDPGAYVVNHTSLGLGMRTVDVDYCKGTIEFEAKAGQAVYIGNFVAPILSTEGVHMGMPRLDAAKAQMAGFPNVRGTLTEEKPRNVPFPRSSACDR